MLKTSASGVLASFRPSTYPRGYASGPSLAAALLDELFEHPAGLYLVAADVRVFNSNLAVRVPESPLVKACVRLLIQNVRV